MVDRFRFRYVLEVPAADALDEGGRCEEGGCRGPLRHALALVGRGRQGAVDVPLQVGGDRAWVERGHGDAAGCPAPGRLNGEEDVRGLRLPVGGPGLVEAEAEVDVVEQDR